MTLMQREHFPADFVGASYRPPSAPYSEELAPRHGARIVTSSVDGARWTVYEMAGESVPGCRGAACLVFDSPGCVRRVWSYPDDWRAMPDDALLRVSFGR